MAFSINMCMKLGLHQTFRLSAPTNKIYFTQVKYLYSHAALGIDNYLHTRQNIGQKFVKYNDNFKTKMTTFVNEKDNLIFTEDLKNMIHLAEPADLDLVMKMINKFNSSSEVRFGSFVFGPIVMRMFYFLDAPKHALESFLDPVNSNFYDQQSSYQILLDLLFNHEMFTEIYEVFEKIKTRQLNMTKFPKYPTVLVMGACYKQNTPESFKYAIDLWSEMNSTTSNPIRRTATFFAGLALKQGAPHIALESISSQKQHYVTIRNIKAVALAELGRLEDSFRTLRYVLDNDMPETTMQHTFFKETITKVQAAVDKLESPDYKKEFENIVKALEDRSLIDNQDLDTHLTATINIQKKLPPLRNTSVGENRMKFRHRHREQLK